MFGRRKSFNLDRTIVVVGNKNFCRFTELNVIDVDTTVEKIRHLVNEGKNWIANYGG